jgi:hypothetical protein
MILGTAKSRNNSLCKLNLRMDGANDGNTFVDSSSSGKTITNASNYILTKTAEKVNGTASAYNSSTAATRYLSVPDSADFRWGDTGKGTVEFWFKSTANVATTDLQQYVISAFKDAGANDYFLAIGYIVFKASGFSNKGAIGFRTRNASTGNSNIYFEIPSTKINNDWHFYTCQVSGGTVQYWIDGIKLSLLSANNNYANYPTQADDLRIFSYMHTSANATGYIDELKWYKNRLLRDTNFKVPNRAA